MPNSWITHVKNFAKEIINHMVAASVIPPVKIVMKKYLRKVKKKYERNRELLIKVKQEINF